MMEEWRIIKDLKGVGVDIEMSIISYLSQLKLDLWSLAIELCPWQREEVLIKMTSSHCPPGYWCVTIECDS